MSWAKLDDRFATNVKIRNAWRKARASVGLYVMGITHAAQHETDGDLDAGWVEDTLPAVRERTAAVDALVGSGLWSQTETGFRIHDYLEYQPSRDQLETRRAADAARKARGRGTQARKEDAHVPADSVGIPVDVRADSKRSPVVPTRPVPSRPEKNSPAVPTAVVEEELQDPLVRVAEDVVGILQRGIDGLTCDEPCKRPTVPVVLAALRKYPVSADTAVRVAADTRGTVQAQDRAPNVAGLFAQKLAAASVGSVAA